MNDTDVSTSASRLPDKSYEEPWNGHYIEWTYSGSLERKQFSTSEDAEDRFDMASVIAQRFHDHASPVNRTDGDRSRTSER
jgi:hypothetical protein